MSVCMMCNNSYTVFRKVGLQFPTEVRSSPSLTASSLETSQPPLQRILGAPSTEIELSGPESDNTPASSAELRNARSLTSTHCKNLYHCG
jgi:hypothetical protein